LDDGFFAHVANDDVCAVLPRLDLGFSRSPEYLIPCIAKDQVLMLKAVPM